METGKGPSMSVSMETRNVGMRCAEGMPQLVGMEIELGMALL